MGISEVFASSLPLKQSILIQNYSNSNLLLDTRFFAYKKASLTIWRSICIEMLRSNDITQARHSVFYMFNKKLNLLVK